MNGTNNQRLELPENVQQQLGVFRSGLWVVETVVAVCGAVVGILAAFLALFLLDRVWDTPVWVRVILALGALGMVGLWSLFWANRWGWRRRDARELARLVQRYHRKLGDRLLGIVELADPEAKTGNVSEELRRAALAQVAKEASGLDFKAAVPRGQRRHWVVAVSALAVVAVAGIVMWPRVGGNVWHRLLNPVASVARYTLVRLQGMPEKKVVAYGEPFAIGATVAPDSSWKPVKVLGRLGEQRPMEAAVKNDNFSFSLAGQTKPGVFAVKAGDARANVAVEPVFRPELVELQALVEPPAYLSTGVVTQDVRKGTVDVLAESRVSFAGKISRELVSVNCNGTTATVSGAMFSLPACEVKEAATAKLEWADVHGLRSHEPFTLKVNVVEDAAPRVEIRGLGRVVAVLEDETLEFEAAAKDDFGVKRLGLTWSGQGNEVTGATAIKGEKDLGEGGPQKRELTQKVVFSPREWNIGPQRIEVRAVAEDYLPGREPVMSDAYYILVLDRAEHAKLVQAEFDRLAERLEELRRMEEALLERNEQLQREIKQAKDTKELAEKLAEQEQAERRNAEQMKKLQEDLAKLIKEAMRNQNFTEEILAKWARLMEKFAQLSGQKMPKVAQSVGNAKQSDSQQQQEGEMKDAVAKQEQVLKEMSEALKQMNEISEQMQVGNFANRLRKMAELQKGVGEQLTKLFPDTVGAVVEQLPVSLRIKVKRAGGEQNDVFQGVKTIRDELGAFVNRTRAEAHTKVRNEMIAMKTVEDLEKLNGLLESKVCQEGIAGAEKWAKQLTDWADLLEPPKKGGGGGGSGGGGQDIPPEVLEALMKLMRVRLAEEGVRNQTRFLEARREKDKNYEPQAKLLSGVQNKLRKTVGEVMEVIGEDEKVAAVLEKVDIAMEDAAGLLGRPQTDLDVVAAETEIIELLTQASDQASKGSCKNAAAMLAMLEQMQRQLGKGTGKTGGGSTAGGMTERDNIPANGDPTGNAAGSRNVNKAGGHDMSRIPAEFRDALESYFEKVEKLR